MTQRLFRYYNTLKNLKPIQIRYQVWYRLRDRFFPVIVSENEKAPGYQEVQLHPFPAQYEHYLGGDRFSLLNQEHIFKETIDWNYSGYGKLWTYHLNYFDFLHQPGMTWETGKDLMDDFLSDIKNRKDGMEPYPISLRTINWIKFMAVHQRFPQEIVDSLYSQYQVLTKKIEYHLLGNHLLENGFSLLFGAIVFQDEKLIRLARKILITELEEQVLEDGAHFELSPMYHVILLQRALEGYNLLINNNHNLQDVENQLRGVIQKMVNWLLTIMFNNGDIPMLNDSTGGQALEPKEILNYAQKLGFSPQKIQLKESGYRKFEFKDFEMVADVGEVGPNYQPGHAHSDTLSFVLYHQRKPIIVDRGISTYEKNQTRKEERGTASHNTVMVNGKEQTDVWGGFRVGRRAKPLIITDEKDRLKATHTGYDSLGYKHIREWKVNDHEILIRDEIQGLETNSLAYIHLHPDIKPVKLEEGVFKLKSCILVFEYHTSAEIEKYSYSTGFNKKKDASCLIISFVTQLKTHIISN